ncbi:MAG: SPOR domain-containing protein [Kofleriaceae bacterium]|nr:SPOR domain-containing protein [Kofleriaceae bacterium]
MPPRETELYKDKVEVSLDGRQIFYLFFGGAVIVGIVFVLGVLVGRRVEARGHIDRARTHAAADPLAALDRLEGNGQLSFRASLAAGKEQPTDVEKEIEQRAAAKALESKKSEDKKSEDKLAKSEEKKAEEKKTEDKKSEAKKSEDKKSEDKKSDDKLVKSDDMVSAKTEVKSDAQSEDKKSDDKKSEESKESKTRYTLQLSSFQDEEEAKAFLNSVKAQGYSAQIKQAEVEGKGTFYRVRMGSYSSMEAANEARAEFEKNAKKSASVMKL